MALPPYKTTDPNGITVFLYDERFNKHIKNRHPEASVHCILETIENADLITQDISNPTGENYYYLGANADTPEIYMKVCVNVKGDIREVVTAFEADIPKPKEPVLWQR